MTNKIDLLLYSQGGSGDVPWKIVPMIREFCSEFGMIVPYKAYSAATLIALGADEIVMGKKAELGPVDPSIGSALHPPNPYSSGPLQISVEDLTAFVKFIKEMVGITNENQLISSVNILIEKVGPLALGNLTRFYFHNRMLVDKLLKTHKEEVLENTIKHICDSLTEKAFFHGHAIGRKEAKDDIQLNVIYPDENLEQLIWNLYLEYEKEMLLNDSFQPEFILTQNGCEKHLLNNVCLAFIESTEKVNISEVDIEINRKRKMPTNLQISLNIQLPQQITGQQIPAPIMQQFEQMISAAVTDQIRKQSPVEGIEVKSISGGWKEG